MDPPAPRSWRESFRGRFSRQQRIREAIGEARAALNETLGVSTPSLPDPKRWLGWSSDPLCRMSKGWRHKDRRLGFSLALGPHLSTLVVLLFLVTILAGRGFGSYIATVDAASPVEGGPHLLSMARYAPTQEQTFGFAVAPITVVPPRVPQLSLEVPEEEPEVPEDGNLARSEVLTYTALPGDSLYSIAERFGIAAYTVFWVNELRTPDDIEPGVELMIPPLSGVPHIVRSGETLYSIAELYGVRPGNIVGYPYNGLKYPYNLDPGQEVFVPGGILKIPSTPVEDGERPRPTLVQMPGGEKLSWPTWGYISAPFGWSRQYVGFHQGLDIANSYGTAIYAAASGEVVVAGWGTLGWWAALDHGNGFRTEYGHMSQRPLVSEGEQVEKGQLIGYMGSTYGRGGYSTGVHLHFVVRHLGTYIDPLPLLEN